VCSSYSNQWWCNLNFVEIMAFHRAFSVGRFSCSGASPKITAASFLSEGYALTIKKDSTRKFCLGCIKDFFAKKGFRAVEDEKYLTIHMP
jgi:hypothetical protein